MDDGRVVHRGAMAELAEDEALQQRLLGPVAGSASMSRHADRRAGRRAPPPCRRREFDWMPLALLLAVLALVALPADRQRPAPGSRSPSPASRWA